MPYLMRVALPDRPGSLGSVALAIGEAGGDIHAIEIVERRPDGTAVDDVLLEAANGTMPDTIVSACQRLAGVEVLWISQYGGAGSVVLDLELVEALTQDPRAAVNRFVDLLPTTLHVEWAARLRCEGSPSSEESATQVVHASTAAPRELPWTPTQSATQLDDGDNEEGLLRCVAPLTQQEQVVVGRRGGPPFLDSELARLGHLAGLAASIARS